MNHRGRTLVVMTMILCILPIVLSFRQEENRIYGSRDVEFEGYLYRLYKIGNKDISRYALNVVFKIEKETSITTTRMSWCQMLNSDSVGITNLLDTTKMRVPVYIPADRIRVSYLSGEKSIMMPSGFSEWKIGKRSQELMTMLELAFEESPVRRVDNDTSYIIKCVYIDGKFDGVSYPGYLIATEIKHLNPYLAPDCFPVLFDEFWNRSLYGSHYYSDVYYDELINTPLTDNNRIGFKGFILEPSPYRHRNGKLMHRLFLKTGDSCYLPPEKPLENIVVYPIELGRQRFPIINDISEMIRRANDSDTIIMVPYEEEWEDLMFDIYRNDYAMRRKNEDVERTLWKSENYAPILYDPTTKDDLFQCLYIEGYLVELDSILCEANKSSTEMYQNKRLMRIDTLTYCNPFYIPDGYLLWSPLENDVVNSYNFRMYQRAGIDSVLKTFDTRPWVK